MHFKRKLRRGRLASAIVLVALIATTDAAMAHSPPRLQITEQRDAAVGFAVTLWMTHVDALGKHCSALGGKSDSQFLDALTSWQKRNAPYLNAALEYMADIEDTIRASQGEAARQTFRDERKAEFVESTRKTEAVWFPDGKVDEPSCQHLATFVADGSLDLDKNRDFFPTLQEIKSTMPEADEQQ